MSGVAGRRVTAADVARSLGLSRATVGFVLNNTPGQAIPDSTRERVLAEAARLGYRPHRAAQDLRRGSSRVILVVLPEWPLEFRMRQHLEEAALALDEAGYSLVTWARPAGDRARPLWELLSPDVVMGMVPFGEDDLRSMRACGITKIVPDPDERLALEEWAVIAAGPALQLGHLHELGHRRLGFATSLDPRLSRLADARVQVAQRTAARLGLSPLDVRQADHGDGSAGDAVRRWRAAGVTGVAAYNDDVAAVVVSAVIRSGGSVPGDLAVIGHDDSPLAAVFVPSISSVSIDTVSLGRHFAALALHAADGRPLPARDPVEGVAAVVARESTAGG
jgi:DNA-binding LacI/PurR family transcriptional regulator